MQKTDFNKLLEYVNYNVINYSSKKGRDVRGNSQQS